MAGHSKWSNIKHRKGAQDQKRGKIFTKLIREITIASRLGGGDLESNPRLRKAVNNAKSNNMPSEKIDRAIKKGTGLLEGVSYEEIIYEGYGPNGVAIIVEVITDNKNRSVAELRHAFTKSGGSLGETGSVSWMFEKKGQIILEDSILGFDALFDLVIIAGAEDIEEYDDGYIITTPFELLMEVRKVIEEKGCIIKSADYEMLSKTSQKLERSKSEKVINLLTSLENNDDVNKLFSNLEIE
tara:strand:- start:215 stop:937 length:723 start_codon:yes stop_codon:yes gene_type:complete